MQDVVCDGPEQEVEHVLPWQTSNIKEREFIQEGPIENVFWTRRIDEDGRDGLQRMGRVLAYPGRILVTLFGLVQVS